MTDKQVWKCRVSEREDDMQSRVTHSPIRLRGSSTLEFWSLILKRILRPRRRPHTPRVTHFRYRNQAGERVCRASESANNTLQSTRLGDCRAVSTSSLREPWVGEGTLRGGVGGEGAAQREVDSPQMLSWLPSSGLIVINYYASELVTTRTLGDLARCRCQVVGLH